eukprot:8841129-Ditylum_brightwellii.AAC.1
MKWDNLVSGINPADRDEVRFNQEIENLYLHFVNNEARDNMFDYLQGLKRPTKASPRDHANRIEMLVRYANKLPGMIPPMTDMQVKKMVFEQHLMKWCTAYTRAGHSLQIDSLMEIVQYMANEKSFADIEEAQKKRKHGDYDS